MHRRTFIIFAGVTTFGWLAWSVRKQWVKIGNPASYPALADAQRELLGALVIAILSPTLPAQGAARRAAVSLCVENIEATLWELPQHLQREVLQLLWILCLPLTRRALFGAGAAWAQVPSDQVQQFLHAWRHSDWVLKKKAYIALQALVTGSWYANEAAWGFIHYPGPPSLHTAH